MLQVGRVCGAALLLLPGGLVLLFAFNSGGFYAGAPAYVAMLLCVALLVRVIVAGAPLAGLGWPLGVAAGALLAFTLLTLASGLWSHAPGVARVEFDLPLVYLAAMLLAGLLGRTRARLRWMLRALAMAAFIVCACGLITRVLPHLWPTSSDVANSRLSFPVTYWNVLGLLAAIGIVLCVHLTSDLREPRASRIASAAALPVLAATLLYTFSRGAIATCVIALVVYAIVGRPRGLPAALVAAGPATAVALKFAYHANLLATSTSTTPAAVLQGHRVAIAVAGSAVGAAVLRAALTRWLDEWVKRFALPAPVRRRAALAGWASLALAVVIAVAVSSGTIANEYQRFVRPGAAGNAQDVRSRLTDPANNGRFGYWSVAWEQFKHAPAVGWGAGSYANAWARHRTNSLSVEDAHSLYLETLEELGVVGLALLLITILTILARVAARARGSGRVLYAAVFAVLLAWAIHAGVDWDWEMPVVTVIFFFLGGFVLGRRVKSGRAGGGSETGMYRGERRPRGYAAPLVRASIAVCLIPLAVLPAYVWLSQGKLDDAAYAFAQGDCVTARQSALSSISILGDRAEPYEIASYCDLRLGMSQAALSAIEKAVSLDPRNWNYRYGLALMRGAAGLDPRGAAWQALSLNPHDLLAQSAWSAFRSGRPARWKAAARSIAAQFNSL